MLSGRECETALSSFLPALCACLSCSPWLHPPLHADLWELVWNVLITDGVFFRLRVPLRSGWCCSGKQPGGQRGNERQSTGCPVSAHAAMHGLASPHPRMPRCDFTSFVTPNVPKSVSINTSRNFYCQYFIYLAQDIPSMLFRWKRVFQRPEC